MAGFPEQVERVNPKAGLIAIRVEKIKKQVERSVRHAAAALEKKGLNTHLVGRHPPHAAVVATGVKNPKRGKKDEEF